MAQNVKAIRNNNGVCNPISKRQWLIQVRSDRGLAAEIKIDADVTGTTPSQQEEISS
jgi:transposase-like protein